MGVRFSNLELDPFWGATLRRVEPGVDRDRGLRSKLVRLHGEEEAAQLVAPGRDPSLDEAVTEALGEARP